MCSKLSHKRQDFRKKIIGHKLFFDFSNNFVWNINRCKKNSMRLYLNALHVQCPSSFADCNETWIFLTVFRKIRKSQISWDSFHRNPSSVHAKYHDTNRHKHFMITLCINNIHHFKLLKPNDIYICRTAALNSRRYILNIYSTNIHTEYFKHAA